MDKEDEVVLEFDNLLSFGLALGVGGDDGVVVVGDLGIDASASRMACRAVRKVDISFDSVLA